MSWQGDIVSVMQALCPVSADTSVSGCHRRQSGRHPLSCAIHHWVSVVDVFSHHVVPYGRLITALLAPDMHNYDEIAFADPYIKWPRAGRVGLFVELISLVGKKELSGGCVM